MKTALLFFSLFFSLSVFAQNEEVDSLTVLPTHSLNHLTARLVCATPVVSCYSPSYENNYLGPDGSRRRGSRYDELDRLEKINIRSGLRGQYSHYYINGIRVNQDFTPEEIIEEINIHTSGTPAFDEGVSLSPRQNQLLIY